MPIETVNISFNEPEPTVPEVPFEDPVIREWDTKPYKTVMIHLNKRIAQMTVADLQMYRHWLDYVPGILKEDKYHRRFIRAFLKDANKLAEIIEAGINAVGTVSTVPHV